MEFLTHNWILVVLAVAAIVAIIFGPAALRRYKAYSLYQAGASYMRDHEYEKAAAIYRQSIQLWPKYFGAYNNLGVALSEQGKVDESLQVYQEALKINPEHAPTLNNIGVAYYRTGHYAESAAAIEKAISLRPSDHPDQARLYFNLGLAYLALGQTEKAQATYEQALRLAKPQDLADARNGLNELYKKLPERPAGASTIEQLLATQG